MTRSYGELLHTLWPRSSGDEEAAVLAPAVSLWEIWRAFWPDLKPLQRWLWPLLATIVMSPVLEAITIALYGLLIDEVLAPRDFAALPAIAGAYIGLTLFSGLVSFADGVISAHASEQFLAAVRVRMFAHVQSLAPQFFSDRRRGDLVNRVVVDIDDVEEIMISGPAEFLGYLFRIVVFTGALFMLDWRMALLALTVIPLFALASRYFARRVQAAARKQRSIEGAVSSLVEEGIGNIPLVRVYGLEALQRERFAATVQHNARSLVAMSRLRAAFSPVLEFVELGGVLIVVAAGAFALAQGQLTLGALLVFLTYLSQLLVPVNGLSQLVGGVASATAGAERVLEILAEPVAEVDLEDAAVLPPGPHTVTFSGVTFTYPGGNAPALEDISFTVSPGQTLAIVGASGAGKSTIARLMLRFHDSDAGTVVIDDRDIRTVAAGSLRSQMATVLQESLLLSGTVRDNIALGKPGVTDAAIRDAAVAAEADSFITALPGGYDALIGQGGSTLSGGQRQRLAIARALLRDAPIVILDEPTSGLDAETTERVLAAIRRLTRGRTTVLISHQMMTTQDADEIIVLDGGRIVERGNHNALMARDGAYARLYRRHHADGRKTGADARDLAAVA